MEMILGSGYEGRLVQLLRGFHHHSSGRRVLCLANLMYYALVIMRRQKAIFTVYLAAAAAAAVLSGFLVSKIWNQWGGRLLSAAYDRISDRFRPVYGGRLSEMRKRRMPVMEEVTRNTEIADGRERKRVLRVDVNHTHL